MAKRQLGMCVRSGIVGAAVLLVAGTMAAWPSYSLAAGAATADGGSASQGTSQGKTAQEEGVPERSATLLGAFELTEERAAQAAETNATCGACHVWENAAEGAGASAQGDKGTGASTAAGAEADANADAEAQGDEKTGDVPGACLSQTHADQGVSCVDCHTDADKLDDIHAKADGKKAPSRLRATKVTDEACLACHVDRATLAEAMPDAAVVDGKETAVNPHALPDFSDHQKITCAQCHVAHDPANLAEDAKSTCLTCHHADVFECGTCH